MLSNPGGSVQWPERRRAHSSVLINNNTGPHLLVVGGWGTWDSWLFDINKRIWKQLVYISIIITLHVHNYYYTHVCALCVCVLCVCVHACVHY